MPQIKAVIGADTRQFNQAMKNAQKQLQGFGSITKNLMGGMAAYFSGSAILSFFDSAAKKYDIQVQAENRVATAIKSTGSAAQLTAQTLYDTASALQSVSKFGDEEILTDVTTNLLTFTNVSGTVFKDAQKAILDLSSVLRQDLQSSTIQVGKALNDPIAGITALKRVGVTFTDEQKNVIASLVKTGQVAEAQKLILQELNKEFGGQAEAAAKVGMGAIKQFDNALGDLQENIGSYVVPMLSALAKKVTAFFQATSVGRGDQKGALGDMQKDVNQYMEANPEERQKIRKHAEDMFAIQTDRYKKAKEEENKEARAFYSIQMDVIREFLEKIDAFEENANNAEVERKKVLADAYAKEHGLIKDIESELKTLAEAKAMAYSLDEIKRINRKIETLEAEKKMYDSLTDSISRMQSKQGMSTSEIVGEFQGKVDQQNDVRLEQRMQPRAIPDMIAATGTWGERMQGLVDVSQELNTVVSSAFANMAISVGESLGALLSGTGNMSDMFNGMLAVIADFMDSLGKALIQSAVAAEAFQNLLTMNPVAAIAAGIALVALASVVKSKLSAGPGGDSGGQPRKFADGGVVFGPTFGLLGEYANAGRNPEVVSPLSTLQSLLGNNGDDVKVYGALVGADIRLSNSRAAARRSRIRAGR